MKNKIIRFIRKEVKQSKARGVVLGLSGGVDSAVAAVLCEKSRKSFTSHHKAKVALEAIRASLSSIPAVRDHTSILSLPEEVLSQKAL